jgi:hypothetical protein
MVTSLLFMSSFLWLRNHWFVPLRHRSEVVTRRMEMSVARKSTAQQIRFLGAAICGFCCTFGADRGKGTADTEPGTDICLTMSRGRWPRLPEEEGLVGSVARKKPRFVKLLGDASKTDQKAMIDGDHFSAQARKSAANRGSEADWASRTRDCCGYVDFMPPLPF